MIAYFNGKFLPAEEVYVSPNDRGFLFADGLYEVILCCKGEMFRAREHLTRLEYGARELRLPVTAFSYLEEVAGELLKRNLLENRTATIYIQVTRGAAVRSHAFPGNDTPLTVYVTARAFDPEKVRHNREHGIAAITVPDQRWARCDIKTIGLTANILANQLAVEQGAGEAVFVKDGVLIEGSHSNFAGVCNGALVTYPACNSILNGITRQTVLELAENLGIPVELRPVYEKDLASFSEFMMLATTVEVTPVVCLDGKPVANGTPGPVVRRLQKEFVRFCQSS